MIAYPWGALVTGTMFVIAGLLCLARHFLLEPWSPNYPKAPKFVRHGIFGFASVLLFIGLQFIWVFFNDARTTMPPQPSPNMQLLAAALVIYKSVLLGNIISQRYPERVWKRLNRMNEFLQSHYGSLRDKLARRIN